MTQEELQLLQSLLAKASKLLELPNTPYIGVSVTDEEEELVLLGYWLYVYDNANGNTRKISSKGVEDNEILIS